ncbi:MAG: chorismate synthase [Deltaproteobacteria bacterium]|nr:chorismate synthase [Candidatus Anaeroferrophillus wilburensis]MBN2888102.1 chorismate synthase [Deltaproteobacteria bacterium]
MLTCLTAGESHGPQLTAILSGIPAGVPVSAEKINYDLARRQQGYGRGGRMAIEADQVTLLSGVRFGTTTGNPITMAITNKDWKNWQQQMSPAKADEGFAKAVTRPRPGHVDLPGCLKYNQRDARNILERASARETAIRVAVGALCKALLEQCTIQIFSYVTAIGTERVDQETLQQDDAQLAMAAEQSSLRLPDPTLEEQLKKVIDLAKKQGDTLGGIFRVIIRGLPPGIGSHIQYDSKLDGRLAQAIMSIQAVKGVEIGLGFQAAELRGSLVHDEIAHNHNRGFYHLSNNAGGIEGGISNGEDIIITAAMKPIPTLYQPLKSVDMITKQPFEASVERSDTCAVPAAAVVGEAAAAFEITRLLLEKFGGDHLDEFSRNYHGYCDYLTSF